MFTTSATYLGNETVAGCYYPGVYPVKATVSQTAGSCVSQFQWQAQNGSGQLQTCPATLSGDSSSGYDVHFCQGENLEGTVHFPPDLGTFTGSYAWTVSCGSGTTTFSGMSKQPSS